MVQPAESRTVLIEAAIILQISVFRDNFGHVLVDYVSTSEDQLKKTGFPIKKCWNFEFPLTVFSHFDC